MDVLGALPRLMVGTFSALFSLPVAANFESSDAPSGLFST
jgi:hypothetical protein